MKGLSATLHCYQTVLITAKSVSFLHVPYYSLSHESNFLRRSRYVKTKFNSIAHVGAAVVVVDGLGCKNAVRKYDLLVVIS